MASASRPSSGSHRAKSASSTNLASRAGTASGFALSTIATPAGQQSGIGGDGGTAGPSSASGASAASTAGSGHPGVKRRQSVQTSASTGDEQHHRHHATGSSKVGMGARRKSKVNVSTLARNKSSSALAHHHHHGHSTAMSRRDKSRSHTSLANLVGEMVQDAASDSHDRPAHARTRSSRSVSAGTGKGKRRSKEQGDHAQEEDEEEDEFEDEEPEDDPAGEARAETDRADQAATAVVEEDDDGSADWISAASSKATTPDAGHSPESPPPLQFGKKSKRANPAKLAGVQEAGPRTPAVGFRVGTTPTQESSLQGNDNVKRRDMAEQHPAPDARYAPEEAITSEAGHDTPTIERAEPAFPVEEPQPPSSYAPVLSPQHQTKSPTSTKSSAPPVEHASQPRTTSDGLPQPPTINRPSNLRKTSTSTIRSLASTHTTRTPLAHGLRRQPAALQPRLDTRSEGLGEILEQGRSVASSPTALATPAVTVGDAHEPPTSAGGSRHARQDSAGSRKTTGTTGAKPGTLTVQEAEDLARRLRSISGVGDARGGLRRSVSSNNATLAQQQDPQQQQRNRPSIPSFDPPLSASGQPQPGEKEHHDSSPMATLKRASGYFGSITRLAQLTGLTSASTTTSPTSPQHGREHPSPPFSAGSGRSRVTAQQALLSSTQGQSARDTKPGPGPGSGARGGTQVYQAPLVSRFYDLNDRSPASAAVARHAYRPFRSYSAATPPSASAGSPNLATGGAARGRMTPQYQPAPLSDIRSSRARQKMMTQRDAPYDPSGEQPSLTHGGSSSDLEGAGGGGSGSGITSHSGSNLHLPTTPGEDGGGSRSSSSARLAHAGSAALDPEIQRWLVALAKDADKIDKDYACTERFADPVGASMARVLAARKHRDEEARRKDREERARHSSADNSGAHSPAGSALGHGHGQANKGKSKPSGVVVAPARPPTQRSKTAR